MVAYANDEAVRLTKETGFAHFYSRSRRKMWKKGEESGHVQKVLRVLVDCDEDCLLYEVEQKGAACHTGYRSCFYRGPVFTVHWMGRSYQTRSLIRPRYMLIKINDKYYSGDIF